MNQSRGVTLVELVAALGVVALIAAISLPLYRNYIEDAEVAEIELEYESWQNRTRSALSNQEISQCADLIAGTDEGFVSERSTRLSIGVQPVGGNPLNGSCMSVPNQTFKALAVSPWRNWFTTNSRQATPWKPVPLLSIRSSVLHCH